MSGIQAPGDVVEGIGCLARVGTGCVLGWVGLVDVLREVMFACVLVKYTRNRFGRDSSLYRYAYPRTYPPWVDGGTAT